jgi:hypothetical protein
MIAALHVRFLLLRANSYVGYLKPNSGGPTGFTANPARDLEMFINGAHY